jgi:hypothetical protein
MYHLDMYCTYYKKQRIIICWVSCGPFEQLGWLCCPRCPQIPLALSVHVYGIRTFWLCLHKPRSSTRSGLAAAGNSRNFSQLRNRWYSSQHISSLHFQAEQVLGVHPWLSQLLGAYVRLL